MASKSGVRTGVQTSEGNTRRPSPFQPTKPGRSEGVVPNRLPLSPRQIPPKQLVSDIIDEKNLVNDVDNSANLPLADKLGSSLSLADKLESSLSLECGSEEDSKISDQGIGSASGKVSDGAGSLAKTSGREFVESGKSSMGKGSTSSDVSDESSCSSLSSSVNKPHKSQDMRWEAIQAVRTRDGLLGLNHFRLLKRLGCGDIGSVYLSELTGTKCYF
ncbi:hypothetical protein KSS87_011646, partial [Heliosperma pusillum]